MSYTYLTSKFGHLAYLIFGVSLFISCGGDQIPDADNVSDRIELIRFDQSLMALDTSDLSSSLGELEQAHPEVYNLYFRQLIPLTRNGEHNLTILSDFVKNPNVRSSNNKIDLTFKDLDSELNTIGQAIGYLKHYVPMSEIPVLYTLYGDYSYQAFIFEEYGGRDAIGVCLDMFLGKEHNYKAIDPKSPIFSDYISRRYERSYIPIKVLGVMIEDILGPVSGNRLVDHAIYHGKKQYILSKVFPRTSPAKLLEYSDDEYKWCESSELGIWDYFLDQELIFENNQKLISTYINEAPRSKGMPEESPGRTAHYIGYQIIKAYMEKTGATIQELIDTDAVDDIFRKSKYKPRRT